MLRAAVAAKSPLGLEAKKVMEAGALVGDDIVVGLIEEAIQQPECRQGVQGCGLRGGERMGQRGRQRCRGER